MLPYGRLARCIPGYCAVAGFDRGKTTALVIESSGDEPLCAFAALDRVKALARVVASMLDELANFIPHVMWGL
jgi:hypothetical protein